MAFDTDKLADAARIEAGRAEAWKSVRYFDEAFGLLVREVGWNKAAASLLPLYEHLTNDVADRLLRIFETNKYLFGQHMTTTNIRKYKGREFHWLASDNGAWDGPHLEFAGLRDLCLKHCRDRRTIITAGGCLGLFPALWAADFARVVTFEPCPINFEVLSMNCTAENIEKYCAALGYERGETTLWRHGSVNVGTHSTVRESGASGSLVVPQMCIDDLEIADVDLIQLDVEGAEPNIVRGAMRTIKRCWPVVAMETVDADTTGALVEIGYKHVGKNVSDSVWAPSK